MDFYQMLTVDCGLGSRDWATLPPKGILKLKYDCIASYEGITLTASQQFSSKQRESIKTSSWELHYEKVNRKLVEN